MKGPSAYIGEMASLKRDDAVHWSEWVEVWFHDDVRGELLSRADYAVHSDCCDSDRPEKSRGDRIILIQDCVIAEWRK